ncbi:MAG TPA: LysM peptidoglycan-binding domain-containing protein [Flavipsychrobacter sp.]|nr:LysM peptidoglycan-binding domain-containing protein [Flavipsychrobacter sp.]
MQQRRILCIVIMICATLKVSAQNSYETRVRNYIEQYKEWAIAEQKRSGVPAAITLAQGIHETSAGNSELALNANNHFGIKCRREWQGQTYKYTDDAPDECFRKYPSALQSYKDHSDYLAGSKRYEALFRLSIKDYKGWAQGLKRCGYATNPKYAHLLIKIVEEYNLNDFTYAALKDDYNPVKQAEQNTTSLVAEVIPEEEPTPVVASSVSNPVLSKSTKKKGTLSVSYEEEKKTEKAAEEVTDYPATAEYGKLVNINGLSAFYAKKGAVLLEDAFKYNIRYAKLLEINELPDLPLEADMYIYLDKKNSKGIHKTHIVKPGETLLQIAQAQAMQLKYLKYYNRIAANEEPVAGAVLQLQQYSENKPATYVKTVAPREEVASFAGSNPSVIPQGSTRKRGSYVSKKESNSSSPQQESLVSTVVAEERKTIHKEQATVPNIVSANELPATKIVASNPAPENVSEPLPGAAISPTEQKIEVKETEEKMITPVQADDEVAEKIEIVKTEVAAIDNAKEPTPVEPVVVKEEIKEVSEIVAEQPKIEPKPVEPVVVKEEIKEVSEVVAEPQVETKTVEAVAVENVPVKKEAVEYDVVQPAPIIVSQNKQVETAKEEVAAPKAELIEPIKTAKANMKPVATKSPTVVAPAKLAVPEIPEEPKDEFERLKAKLDRVVYAVNTTPTPPKVEEKKPEPVRDVAKPKQEQLQKTILPAQPEVAKTYTVKKGDTAFSIAKKHNISMRQLMDWNKLDFDKVKEGQKLRVKP